MQRRRAGGPPVTAALMLLIALVGLGAVATSLSIREERGVARLRDVRAAELAASRLSAALQQTVAAVRGVYALAVDGIVGPQEFTAFGVDVITDSLYRALAYSVVVNETDRSAFEAANGLSVRDTDGSGGFVAAASRPRHFVVVEVYPRSEATTAILGFDIASDPVRRRAAEVAERSSGPVVSDKISLATSAGPGVFVIHAVRAPSGAAIGFVSSGLAVGDLVAAADVGRDSGVEFSLSMDGVMLAGSSVRGESRSFVVGGRTFVVHVDDGRGVDLLLPLLTAGGTVLLAGAVALAHRQDRRQRSRLAGGAARNRGIAELGQRLAASADSDRVVFEVLSFAGAIVDADHTNVARRCADDPSKLVVEHDTGMLATLADQFGIQSLDESLPLTDCVRAAAAVVVRDLDDYRRRYPHVLDEIAAAGIESVICVPLMFAERFCQGAIGFAWKTRADDAEIEVRTVAATTIAELMSRALERAVVAEAGRSSAESLSAFAQALAAARTTADVEQAVHRHVASIVNARSAALQLDDRVQLPRHEHPAGVVYYAIFDATGHCDAYLTLHWPDVDVPTTTQEAVLTAIGELIRQTLARTILYDQEHQLIVQLQQDLLTTAPEIDGVEIAVHYRPALSVVGLGGDFYDIIVSDSDRIYVVIGDVTGHGTEAVTAMAELKAVINHLLRSDTAFEVVCEHADAILARRDIYATAQIAEINRARHMIRYVNAGHPYPVLRHADGSTELLRQGHRPLLGLTRAAPLVGAPAQIEFGFGDVLVLYTDGLIERRAQPLDRSMRQLAQRIESADNATIAGLINQLVEFDESSDTSDKTDDDIAIVVVRCLQ